MMVMEIETSVWEITWKYNGWVQDTVCGAWVGKQPVISHGQQNWVDHAISRYIEYWKKDRLGGREKS